MTIESPPHIARIKVLSNRYDKGLDLFSGEPLEGDDHADWLLIKELRANWVEKTGGELKA
jgi:hypothetical protein|tara:strand:+ start:223 stop:402 length:180 start_codon:yes stop_codon:yes gene_type:complete